MGDQGKDFSERMEGVITINRYMRFDVAGFLKDSKMWETQKRELQKELDAITEIKGQSDSVGRSGKIGDPVSSVASEREKLEIGIARIDTYQRALSYARGILTEAQNEVLDIFFFKRGYMPPLIDEYGRKYALCRSDVYKARREALEELSRIITERYEL